MLYWEHWCGLGRGMAFSSVFTLGGVSGCLLTSVLHQRKATDPSRFANRGGNLLKEEKQRAKLQKTLSRVGSAPEQRPQSQTGAGCQHGLSLGTEVPPAWGQPLSLPSPPQLQEELESRVRAWEQEREEPFLVKGQPFMEYVTEQWQLFRLEKEKEKQERVSVQLSLGTHQTRACPAWGGGGSRSLCVPSPSSCGALRVEPLFSAPAVPEPQLSSGGDTGCPAVPRRSPSPGQCSLPQHLRGRHCALSRTGLRALVSRAATEEKPPDRDGDDVREHPADPHQAPGARPPHTWQSKEGKRSA